MKVEEAREENCEKVKCLRYVDKIKKLSNTPRLEWIALFPEMIAKCAIK